MYILGLNAYHADSSAALFRDGEMIAAIEEERFTRIKHWAGFPEQSVRFCLGEAGISLADLDFITIGRDPSAKLLSKFGYVLKNPGSALAAWRRAQNSRDVTRIESEFSKIDAGVPAKDLQRKIQNIEHHRSHLASAFFASPFEEAAVLSIDGSGDFTTTMIAHGAGNKINVINSVDFPVSCGLFYTAFTQFLGFPHYGDEYKVMGLAPYGTPRYADKVQDLLVLKKDGLFSWKAEYFVSPGRAGFHYHNNVPQVGNLFSSRFVDHFGPPRQPSDPLTEYHKDLAASVQKVTETLLFHILEHLRKKTNSSNVCVAGGVAQNSVANGKIVSATGFKNVYIPSAGHDAGISMGSALYLYNHVLGRPRSTPINSAYCGSSFSNDQIEQLLRGRKIRYQKLDDRELYERVIQKLIEPGVVGWFSGKAEFGPRALGGRSILADPRNPDAKSLLNSKIKRRENFRPFAPSILTEFATEYFERSDNVPFMEKVFPIRQEKRALIPAVTHVDGTGRLQTVDRTVSPRYYQLIETFRRKTGIPLLLNTSFNENEPIVNTPGEALDCFLRTRMDMLVLENCVVERQEAATN
jgi:carbamoyltransferase